MAVVQSIQLENLIRSSMLLTVILIISFPSPTHSFIPGLKHFFSANPSHPSLPFIFRTDYMDSPDWLLLLLSISVFTF